MKKFTIEERQNILNKLFQKKGIKFEVKDEAGEQKLVPEKILPKDKEPSS